ncbi:hypothetical protein BS78_09G118500, partial [Paspalum vaginatum]
RLEHSNFIHRLYWYYLVWKLFLQHTDSIEIHRASLGSDREIEVAAGKPYPIEKRSEAELVLDPVEHQQAVLHLEPSDDDGRSLSAGEDEAEAGRVGVDLHHGVAADDEEVAAALEEDVDLRHRVAEPRGRQLGGVVAALKGRDGVDPRHPREVGPGRGSVERLEERRVHVRAERRVRGRGAQPDDERTADRLGLLHGDAGGGHEVPGGAVVPAERRRAGEHGGEVAAVGEDQGPAAEDGDAHAVAGGRLAVAREAERQRVGHLLRARDLRGGGGEGDRVERVRTVSGVGGERGDRPLLGGARRQRDDGAGEVQDERVAGLKRRRVEGGGGVLGDGAHQGLPAAGGCRAW